MKTLVIVAHPNMETSVINKRWIEKLQQYPEKYTIHELYKVYPDGRIDVQQEQQLIESHDHLVLQFPFYWFSSPPLLKQWLDEVFTYGWAYGSKGDKLQQRKVALAVSAGIKEADYTEEGKYRYTLGQLLSPFETTFLYCDADYRPFFAFYGAEHEPAANELEQSAQNYLRFMDNL
ncbi:NAD(P)H-dependent oxidoreductase [Paenibacillus sp. AD87]|uniref:NAD(P)H-dependent oxidoreductase n=1 Tax=Paenibacillus sp. AD87 TaxID=1528787 RepID=UPI0007E3E317|nr:NAD(P)H-dependent oxidoreductase [Paenibacillus sp. AD87]OAX50626.1 General stress protein 14 [Paenibacillus sp. AD87]